MSREQKRDRMSEHLEQVLAPADELKDSVNGCHIDRINRLAG